MKYIYIYVSLTNLDISDRPKFRSYIPQDEKLKEQQLEKGKTIEGK